jgi:SOS response regulatory protein OraA/RecX
MEKTWEVKEQEIREQIAKDVIAFLQDTEWYNDEQLTAVVMGEK